MYLRSVCFKHSNEKFEPINIFYEIQKATIPHPGAGKMHERQDIKAKAINITSVKLEK